MRSALNDLSADDMEDDKVLVNIATEATNLNLDQVAKTLHQIKPGMGYKESIAKVGAMKQSELAKTFAFLMNKDEKDEVVTKLKKEGYPIMILFRLKQLMPVGCTICNKVYLNGRL